MDKSLCFALAIGLLAPAPALAWGPEGHEIIAHIAARELTPRARAAVASLLGGDAQAMMAADANWADEIRDTRPETAQWHFVDIELDTAGFDPARDCLQGNCTVAQIEKDRRIAADRRRPAAERAEALKFLIHFVGDVHQPLHAIDNHDKGGNDIKLRIGRRRTSMHHYWDTVLVEALGDDAAAIAERIDAQLSPRQKAAWESGTPADWANESFHLAQREIYARMPSHRRAEAIDLPRGYQEAEIPVVRVQLAKAGLRLAWLLNTTF